jgi:hypothetical protein
MKEGSDPTVNSTADDLSQRITGDEIYRDNWKRRGTTNDSENSIALD